MNAEQREILERLKAAIAEASTPIECGQRHRVSVLDLIDLDLEKLAPGDGRNAVDDFCNAIDRLLQ